MSIYQKITPTANKILKNHSLCNHCLGRLFSKPLGLKSNKILGKKLQNNLKSNAQCFICKNLFDSVNSFLNLMVDSSDGYVFSTFNVGTIIKPSIADRDDYIRSKYKLRGIDAIKTDVTRELGRMFSKKTKKTIDVLDPDVVFTINIKESLCTIRSKPITLFGRYVKKTRNLTQKQPSCTNCSGKGCRTCDFHGIDKFNSIEGKISQLLFDQIGGTIAKFTWIGGEDKTSLVLGKGRPFFVKIQNPLKRNIKSSSTSFESLKIKNLKVVQESPKQPLKFISSIKLSVISESQIEHKYLQKLENLLLVPIVAYEKSGKRSEKKIFKLDYSQISKNEFTLLIDAEGGLPIKRLVTGDNVNPSVSDTLETHCKCVEFDILDVVLQ